MQPRATFISDRRHSFIVIRDHGDVYTGKTVAADAEAVVAHCLQQHGNHSMIYRNRDGLWRELRHDGERFLEIAKSQRMSSRKFSNCAGWSSDSAFR